MLWMGLLYAALIVYGTLFPLSAWTPPLMGWSNPITQPWPDQASRADILVNLLAYMPLGLLLVMGLRRRTGLALAIMAATLVGAGMSFILEVLQSALPSRVTERSRRPRTVGSSRPLKVT